MHVRLRRSVPVANVATALPQRTSVNQASHKVFVPSSGLCSGFIPVLTGSVFCCRLVVSVPVGQQSGLQGLKPPEWPVTTSSEAKLALSRGARVLPALMTQCLLEPGSTQTAGSLPETSC